MRDQEHGTATSRPDAPTSPASETWVAPDPLFLDQGNPDQLGSHRESRVLASPDQLSPDPHAPDSSETHAGRLPAALNASLERLERNSLEVKHFLDTIDDKISRMEPRLEQMHGTHIEPRADAPPPIASMATAASPWPASSASETSSAVGGETSPVSPPIPPGWPEPSTTSERRPVSLAADRRRSTDHDSDDQPLPNDWPSSLSEARSLVAPGWLARHRTAIPLGALALLAFLSLLLWDHHPLASPAASVVAPLSGVPVSQRPTSQEPSLAKPSAAVSTDQSANSDTEALSADSAVAALASRPPAASPAAAPPVPVAAATSATTAIAPESPETVDADAIGPDAATTETSPAGAPSHSRTRRSSGPPPFNVSSGVMAGNLIFSRPPTYPHGLAGLFHPQGTVTLQAIISRTGHVSDLRTISGHILLRGAAKAAVRTWRYRPYRVNGVPVEVATIISVDFHR